uniref:Pre-mRNA splicing Prp18-interacting factor n=1 Tax=Tanacetum cinerariifolium TaxID=118510 RepID=A0A6L2NLF3_TANCI|nr:hypothetical protein [Tanacetum cinerariifolium]
MVKGGLCLNCDFREKNLFNCDPNAYSFDNSNYFPRSQYENHLCSLCGNNSHDGYDCQQQFPFVHEQELSYNHNYDEKEEPSQESDIHQLIEECSTEVSEKQKMEDTMLELVKICQEKEFLCIHEDVDDLIKSALNSKLLLINLNSQRLDKKQHEVKNVVEQQAECGNRNIQSLHYFRVVHKSSISFRDTSQISSIHSIAPILSTKEPEHLLSMGYEHLSITPETESDKVTESNVENLLPIPSKCEVTSEDVIDDDESLPDEDVPAEEFKIYLNPLFDEDEINSDKLDPHCFNVESDFVESLLNRNTFIDSSTKLDFFGELAHVNPEIPKSDFDSRKKSVLLKDGNSQQKEIDVVTSTDDVLPLSVENDDDLSNDPLLEEVNLFLFDNLIPPGIENVADDPEGDIRFLEELLIANSILSHESFDSNFEDNPLIPRPPPEPPDVETNTGEEIPVVMNNKDEDVYYSFIFVIFDKVFSLLSAESDDTIFDPAEFPLVIEVFLCWIFVQFPRSSHPLSLKPSYAPSPYQNSTLTLYPTYPCDFALYPAGNFLDSHWSSLMSHGSLTNTLEMEFKPTISGGKAQPCDGSYCDSCTCTQYGMTLFNGSCDNCIYGNGKPIICTACGRSQYENHLCSLCGNNSHDGYDCQQQFLFGHEQELSYNQKYDAEEFKMYLNPLFDEDEINSDNLLYDNSSLRPPEELNAEIVDTIIESIPSLPIPVQDGNSQQEKIDVVTSTDDVLPPSVKNDDDLSNDPLLEELDLFLSDNSIPSGIKNVADDPEGDICFLEELLIDNSVLSHESFDYNFEDNPLIPRPPP